MFLSLRDPIKKCVRRSSFLASDLMRATHTTSTNSVINYSLHPAVKLYRTALVSRSKKNINGRFYCFTPNLYLIYLPACTAVVVASAIICM